MSFSLYTAVSIEICQSFQHYTLHSWYFFV